MPSIELRIASAADGDALRRLSDLAELLRFAARQPRRERRRRRRSEPLFRPRPVPA